MRFIALVFTALIVLQAGAQRPYVDAELGALATKLWDSDPNRLRVGRDLILNWQGALTNQDDARDLAPAPLCTIKTNKLKSSPVYNSFLDLLDNYEHRVGFTEVETPKKRSEVNRFLEAVLSTETMKGFHRYLVQKKLASPDIAAFKMELHNLWFQPYKRLRRSDSSAFEHVFIGEAKNTMVIGFHNWITFCTKEHNKEVNYFGHATPKRWDPEFKRALRFSLYNSFRKPFGTIVFGSSIEFEIGLYTTAFLRSRSLFKGSTSWPAISLNLGPTNILIQCHPHYGNHMGSCYVK